MFQVILANHPVEPRHASEIQDEPDFPQPVGHFVVDDDPMIDDHVHDLPSKGFAAIINHHRHFAFYVMATKLQLLLEGERIDVLTEAAPEPSVDFIEGSDDRERELFVEESTRTAGWHPSIFVRFVCFVSSFCCDW